MNTQSKRVTSLAIALLAAGFVLAHRDAGPSATPARDSAAPAPRAVIAHTVHDFGFVQPAEFLQHAFVIANAGDVPLTLERGQIGHVNLMVDLPDAPIAPGAEAVVRLKSRPSRGDSTVRHSVQLATNDPQRQSLALTLCAAVRATLAAHPFRVVLHPAADGSGWTGHALLYSQEWPELDLADVQSSSGALRWTVAPVQPADLAAVGGRSGCRLQLFLPPSAAEGPFFESLVVRAGPRDGEGPQRTLVLHASDRDQSPISITGGDNFNGNTLSLGVHPQGTRLVGEVLVKVRDPHRDLTVIRSEIQPGLLQARLEPCPPDGRQRGLYLLRAEVPPDAPACDFMGYRMGEVRLYTDHPTVPLLLLRVEFGLQGESSIAKKPRPAIGTPEIGPNRSSRRSSSNETALNARVCLAGDPQ